MIEAVIDPNRPHLGGNTKGGNPKSWSFGVWQSLVDRYEPRTMLDVGCGTGDALRWFAAHGVTAIGLEGLRINADACGVPVLVHDLTAGPVEFANIDLVWCSELVEHVEERFMDNLLSAVCCGRVLAMTHAVPGQGGFHHVNERPAEYWRERIEPRGFRLAEAATVDAWALAGDTYFAKTGMIFERVA